MYNKMAAHSSIKSQQLLQQFQTNLVRNINLASFCYILKMDEIRLQPSYYNPIVYKPKTNEDSVTNV